ncbi:hypothetical protein CVIRNUC_005643 [Coccomyxa viridis]|uniref:ApaG domain-containing protein n=1 Tax=Coccomyxa viridis TaxID=1274662 RepID=A0AAV1I926_9CHLO|nr:hypothetical protein CVIRNUC_005643 [Coccomyxa viridis]
MENVGKYGPLGKRAAVAWQKIEDVLAQDHPCILASLRPGAEEQDLDKLSERLGTPLPEAFRVIYRFHDGQHFSPSFAFWGLFGWFNVYHAVHSTSVLPLSKVTQVVPGEHFTIFASACPDAFPDDGPPLAEMSYDRRQTIAEHRQLGISMKSGNVYAFANSRGVRAAEKLVREMDAGLDHVLQWFEAYAEALSTRYFEVADGWDLVQEDYGEREIMSRVPRDSFKGISIIPRKAPGQMEAVTRGIKVSASVVFLPDNPMTRSVDVYEYAYSIRFTLLPEEEQLRLAPSARPTASAQLLSRHWVILDERGACTNTIEGEAVIGKYPHLTHAKPSFEYQSCTNLGMGKSGSMAGHFTFVEGSIAHPTGPEFNVQCPRFYQVLPDWIF